MRQKIAQFPPPPNPSLFPPPPPVRVEGRGTGATATGHSLEWPSVPLYVKPFHTQDP